MPKFNRIEQTLVWFLIGIVAGLIASWLTAPIVAVLAGLSVWAGACVVIWFPQLRDERGRFASRWWPWMVALLLVLAACKPEPITPPAPPPPSPRPTIAQAEEAALKLATDQVEEVVKPAERGAQRITEATATASLTPPQRQQVTEGVGEVRQAAENANAIATRIKLEVAGPLITAGQQSKAVDDAAAKLTKQVESLQANLATAQQDVEQARREARESFAAQLTTWAAISAALAVPCLILAGWQVFRGSIAAAITLGVVAACLIGAGVALWVIAAYWLWIVGVVCVVGAGLVAWLVWLAIDRQRRTTALTAVVRAVEEAEPTGGAIKSSIASKAGKRLAEVKGVITAIKAETGLIGA